MSNTHTTNSAICSVQTSVLVIVELVLMHKISASLLWPTLSRRQCFTTIGAASLWDRKFNRRHFWVWAVYGQYRRQPKWRQSFNSGTTSVEQLTRCDTKNETVPTNGPRKPSRRWDLSLRRLAERKSFLRHSSSVGDILQTAATWTCCKKDLCTQNSVGRRSAF
jgi:hypothetical protein